MKLKSIVLPVLTIMGLTNATNAQTFGLGVTDIDGNQYQSVLIGNQEWITSNLRTTKFSNGDSIPFLQDLSDLQNTTASGYTNTEAENVFLLPDSIFGKLYNWYAVQDCRNVCPTGWHVPNENEWLSLINFIDPNGSSNNNIVGGALKVTGNIYWNAPNVGATNAYNFSAVSAGYRGFMGGPNGYNGYGPNAHWWTRDTSSTSNANFRAVNFNSSSAITATWDKKYAFSIRCVKGSISTGNNSGFSIPSIINIPNGNSSQIQLNGNNNFNSIQWQSNAANTFWGNLSDNASYSGTNSTTLTINGASIQNHDQQLRAIVTQGICIDTSNVALINILDTCITNVTIYDTLLTTVTDTLVINAVITGINPPNNLNTLKVFPNPANTHITIDYGNFNAMSGYTLTIVNSVGQTVFTTPINQQTSYIDLSTWTGNGIYFVQLIDPQNITIENRKIVIQ
jgi:uncharacterized protein (TIGR02145 family)